VSLLVLHEPFATSLDRSLVAGILAARARATIVLVVTASHRDARALGGRTLTLTRGGVAPGVPPLGPLRGAVELAASVPDPERFAAALSSDPGNAGFEWQTHPGRVALSGTDAEKMSRALLRASDVSGVGITRLSHRSLEVPGGPPPAENARILP
jgi:hypothetical protein